MKKISFMIIMVYDRMNFLVVFVTACLVIDQRNKTGYGSQRMSSVVKVPRYSHQDLRTSYWATYADDASLLLAATEGVPTDLEVGTTSCSVKGQCIHAHIFLQPTVQGLFSNAEASSSNDGLRYTMQSNTLVYGLVLLIQGIFCIKTRPIE
jgi:hypothetical protein